MAVLAPIPLETEPRVRPLSRAEYDRLIAEGFFEGERIELLRGALIEMTPQYPKHAGRVQQLGRLFFERAGDVCEVRIQLPLVVGDHSEPEPDLALVARGRYDDEHPTTAYLVVEVALSSAPTDLGVKAGIYAQAAVAEYWVLDLPNACVHIHRRPSSIGYEEVRVARVPERLALVALPEIAIGVDELLG